MLLPTWTYANIEGLQLGLSRPEGATELRRHQGNLVHAGNCFEPVTVSGAPQNGYSNHIRCQSRALQIFWPKTHLLTLTCAIIDSLQFGVLGLAGAAELYRY